eukprot:TRINITY_DN1285_c0_g1_i2.p1 TRINITY_DN1285_c0_g1~~TRINITY_DN1285_c0_g1_i2.p1  ORF type:complete len:102 (-),score=12.76 TRINITY_DN1285_c0_g1_i2:354-659(-)
MELLETVWAYLFDNFSPYWILTLGTFVLHFVFYFGLSAVYFILETMPSMQKYKIQKIEKNTKEMKWHCFIEILKGDIFPQLLMMTFVYPVISWMGARLGRL